VKVSYILKLLQKIKLRSPVFRRIFECVRRKEGFLNSHDIIVGDMFDYGLRLCCLPHVRGLNLLVLLVDVFAL
jgi:hypothetical protein